MRHAWLLLAIALAGGAAAQQVRLEPSPAVRCLSPKAAVEAGPEYPFIAYKRGVAGRVKVELEFTGADLRPAVKVLAQEGPEDSVGAFVDAVKEHVRQFRVPCLQAGDVPARLSQEYVFTPDRRQALWSAPVDTQDAEQARQLRCVRHESAEKSPAYPRVALAANVQGRVLARLRFDAPDKAPQAEVYARQSAASLRLEVERWVSGYRMPCHSGGPVTGEWTFIFVLEDAAFGFKPITLQQLLGSARDIDQQSLAFDTTTMNCPFDLHFTYRQPFLPNRVGELAPSVAAASPAIAVNMPGRSPERLPLLQWLAGVELDLGRRALDSIYGDTALVTVPCLKINLKPKEKS